MVKDDMQGSLIEPNFYSVIKEFGGSTKRFRSGKYKSVFSQCLWIAYLVGQNDTYAQHEMEKYPDDDQEPPEED